MYAIIKINNPSTEEGLTQLERAMSSIQGDVEVILAADEIQVEEIKYGQFQVTATQAQYNYE